MEKNHPIRIYPREDLMVDNVKDNSCEFWIVTIDLDGQPFAQPISSVTLVQQLMSVGLIPLKEPSKLR